jgi:hypothetical protein
MRNCILCIILSHSLVIEWPKFLPFIQENVLPDIKRQSVAKITICMQGRQGKITEVVRHESSDGRAGAALLVYGMYHSFILTAVAGWHGVGHGIKCKDKEKWLLPKNIQLQ